MFIDVCDKAISLHCKVQKVLKEKKEKSRGRESEREKRERERGDEEIVFCSDRFY